MIWSLCFALYFYTCTGAENKRLKESSALNGTSVSHPSSQGSQIIAEEMWKSVRATGSGCYKERVFPRLSMEIAHMNSHWLGKHVQDLLCLAWPDQEHGGGERRSEGAIGRWLPLEESQFSLKLHQGADPGGLTALKRRPYIQQYAGCAKCTW